MADKRTNVHHSQLIELWETYLFQLDAEDESSSTFFPPGVSATSPDPSATGAATSAPAPDADNENTGRTSEDTAAGEETLVGSEEGDSHVTASTDDGETNEDEDEAEA